MSWMPVTSDTSKSCFTVFTQVMCVRPGSPAWVLALTLVALLSHCTNIEEQQ